MDIKLSAQDTVKFNNLLSIKEINISVADLLNELCLIRDEELSNELSKSNNKNEIVLKALKYLGVGTDNKENLDLIHEWVNPSINLIDLDHFTQNIYNSHINCRDFKENIYSLKIDIFPKFTFFPLDEIKIDSNNFKELSSIGISSSDYRYLTLYKGDDIWMNITPNEINTMSPYVSRAKGNVLVGGLGLGYYAYMISQKDNVKKITIVENDIDIINLFKKHILPFFNKDIKINIIYGDVLTYFKSNSLNEFDYIFIDIWHDANDGLPIYIECQKILNNRKADYWLEESIIQLYRRCMLSLLEEQMDKLDDSCYRKAKTATDKIINGLYFKTKHMKINSYNEIISFISKENILKLIRQ